MCGIENLTLLKARTSGVNACIMVICRQLKKCYPHARVYKRNTEIFSNNKQRYSVMYALVAVKFRDPTLRKRLLDTREAELKEWVKIREGYWSALTYSGQAGQNMLGKILMRVREFIREHQNPPTAKRWPDVTRLDHKTGGQSTPHCQTPSAQ